MRFASAADGTFTLRWFRRPHIADPMRLFAGEPMLARGEVDDYRVRFLDASDNEVKAFDDIAARAGASSDKQKLVLTRSEVAGISGLEAAETVRFALAQKSDITGYGFERIWEIPVRGEQIAIGPPIPADFAAATSKSMTAGAVELSWTASTGAVTYEYRWRTSAVGMVVAGDWTEVVGLTVTSARFIGTDNVSYDFEVRARNSDGASDWSDTQSATGEDVPLPAPSQPSVGGIFRTPPAHRISWSYANAQATFDYRWRVGLIVTPWSNPIMTGSTAKSVDYVGVTGVFYRYQVRARVGSRVSAWSAETVAAQMP